LKRVYIVNVVFSRGTIMERSYVMGRLFIVGLSVGRLTVRETSRP